MIDSIIDAMWHQEPEEDVIVAANHSECEVLFHNGEINASDFLDCVEHFVVRDSTEYCTDPECTCREEASLQEEDEVELIPGPDGSRVLVADVNEDDSYLDPHVSVDNTGTIAVTLDGDTHYLSLAEAEQLLLNLGWALDAADLAIKELPF
jgi:hypothetical protein